MSSQQRSASMDATVQQVADLTRANNALNARLETAEREHDALLQWVVKIEIANDRAAVDRRRDAVERSFLARLRWLFTGR